MPIVTLISNKYEFNIDLICQYHQLTQLIDKKKLYSRLNYKYRIFVQRWRTDNELFIYEETQGVLISVDPELLTRI